MQIQHNCDSCGELEKVEKWQFFRKSLHSFHIKKILNDSVIYIIVLKYTASTLSDFCCRRGSLRYLQPVSRACEIWQVFLCFKMSQMPTVRSRGGKVWGLDGGNDYVPLAMMESNARQQFVHLHLWTVGLVTITGPGKKTLQSHYNNDSNSGQDRRSLCRPSLFLFLLLFLPLFSFPTSTLTFSSFYTNTSSCLPLKSLFISLWVSLLFSATIHT